MFTTRNVAGLCAAALLLACSPAGTASRGSNLSAPAVPDLAAAPLSAPQYNVVHFDAVVPSDLLVSEADVYLPRADIVWHGDPVGDRRQQVEAIFEHALALSTFDMSQGRPVVVMVQLEKFHGVTPKTRATVGGNFGIRFFLTVLDAETRQAIDGPRLVTADIKASGGVRALREEQRGITQKSVVTNALAGILDHELSQPGQPPAGNLNLTVWGGDLAPSAPIPAE